MRPLRYLLLSLCLLLTSCSQNHLSVYSDFLSHENLASYHVGTPDPRLNNPPVGQRLIISWSVPSEYFNYDDLHIMLTIRFCNREEIAQKLCLKKTSGTYFYMLLNDDYFAVNGIRTYKVELIGSGCVLEQWQHQIWAELIELDDQDEMDTDILSNDIGEVSAADAAVQIDHRKDV